MIDERGSVISLRALSTPRRNCVEDALIASIDAERGLRFRCSLWHALAARLRHKPRLRSLVVESVRPERRDGVQSTNGRLSVEARARSMRRLALEIAGAVHDLACAADEPQRSILTALEATIRGTVRRSPGRPKRADSPDILSLEEAVQAALGLIVEGVAADTR